MPILNKDMSVCISLSGTPSNLGTRFHNYLYDELGLNFVYKAFATDDLAGAIGGVRALGIRGTSVSMPFKRAVIALVDEVEESAASIDAVNSIVNDDGRLVAFNTDFEAVTELLTQRAIDTATPVVVHGSGGMARAVVGALRADGFGDVTVLARNAEDGGELADRYGYAYRADEPTRDSALLINATPLGMAKRHPQASAFSADALSRASAVFDVVAFPVETPLVRQARAAGLPVITGAEVSAAQAARQFARYTGVELTDEQIARASQFSRQE